MNPHTPNWRIFRIQRRGSQFHTFAQTKDLKSPEQLIAQTTSIESARAVLPNDVKQVYQTVDSEQWIR